MRQGLGYTARMTLLLSVALVAMFLMLALCESTSAQPVTKGLPPRAIVVKQPEVKRVRNLPANHATIRHNGVLLHISKGRFYRSVNSFYILSMPPVGVRVNILPPSRVLFRFEERPYYCFGGVIYRKIITGGYEVVAPEIGMIVPELPEVGVSELSLDGRIYYKHNYNLYRAVPTRRGVRYEVIANN